MSTLDVFISFSKLPLSGPADDGDMLTTCPRCRHSFQLQSVSAQTPCCLPPPTPPIVLSATLHLPLGTASCTVSVTTDTLKTSQHGGYDARGNVERPAMLQKGVTMKTSGGNLIVASCLPEPSPSAPLSFVLPTTNSRSVRTNGWSFPMPGVIQPHSETDLQRLSSTLKALRTSGWYYEGLSWQDSAALLMPTSPGTFLVRDSSDPRFLFSLSVQTDRGPTSVRIHYINGHFRLDAEPRLAPAMPVFVCVVNLIEYYVRFTDVRKNETSKGQVWIDCAGQMYSNILLVKPLYQKERFPSLQHLARLSINKLAQNGCYVPTYGLPVTLQKYLVDYPFSQ